jgi:putative IMPACT (imprinted ancient) family translation regulator
VKRETSSEIGNRKSDEHEVPAATSHAELREKASRFVAFVIPIADASDAAREIARLAKEHYDASHVCFAWKHGTGDAARRRSSDAGEPAGTAGAPLAAAIDASLLTDVLVAVVRHFGGTKLGKGNLARAYRAAATEALSAAPRRTVWQTRAIEVLAPWERVAAARRLIAPPDIRLVEESAGELCRLRLEVRASRVEALRERLREARLDWRDL